MRMYKLIPFLGLFLLLSGGQSTQTIERADAACCPWWICGKWSGLVYGGIELHSATATITIGEKSYPGVEVSQDLVQAFKGANITTPVYGFLVLNTDSQKKPLVTAFVPADYQDQTHKNKKKSAEAVEAYNKMFEEYHQKKGAKQ